MSGTLIDIKISGTLRLGSVVRMPDSAIHWIAIFSTFVKLPCPINKWHIKVKLQLEAW